jgi:hypothetical protein
MLNMKFVTNVLQRKNVGDSVVVKPNLSVVLNMGIHVGGESSTISLNSHRFFCLPCLGDELAVAEQITRMLIVRRIMLRSFIGVEESLNPKLTN